MKLQEFIKKCNYRCKKENRRSLTESEVTYLKKRFAKRLLEKNVNSIKRLREKTGNTFTQKDLAKAKRFTLKQLREKGVQKLTENKSPVNSLAQVIKSYKKMVALQEKIDLKDVKISYKELRQIKEQVNELNRRGVKLTEADLGMDPSMGAPTAGDPNAGMGPAPVPGGAPVTPVDPTIVAQVQDAKNSIDALAASVGVQSTDLNADPNAGLPPVDGMQQPGDPNAAAAPGAAPMMESKNKNIDKLDTIRERIAARRKHMQENGAQEGAKKDLQRIGIAGGTLSSGQENKGAETNAEQVVVPAAGTLANGYTSGKAAGETKPSKTWPTKSTKTSDTGGALQGAGASQKKVKESEECCEDEKCEDKEKIQESEVVSVTQKYVDKYFEDKLDFQKIRESLSSGLLG